MEPVVQPSERAAESSSANIFPMALKKHAVTKLRIDNIPEQKIALNDLHPVETHAIAEAVPQVEDRSQ
jgi:hypothetical protein